MHGSMLAHVFSVGGRDAAVRLFQIHIVDIEIEFLQLTTIRPWHANTR